jgi:hypothetical protein
MIRYSIAVLTFALLASTVNAEPVETLPSAAKIVKLEAHPPSLELKTPFEYSQLLLTAIPREWCGLSPMAMASSRSACKDKR